VGAGVALIVAGSSRSPASSTSFFLVPTLGHGLAGMSLNGRF
jgi:hypothetical protein